MDALLGLLLLAMLGGGVLVLVLVGLAALMWSSQISRREGE